MSTLFFLVIRRVLLFKLGEKLKYNSNWRRKELNHAEGVPSHRLGNGLPALSSTVLKISFGTVCFDLEEKRWDGSVVEYEEGRA